jgi:transposase-like protein
MGILTDPEPDMLAVPRINDGAIDMQELIRRLAEQVVNAIMDSEADQLCSGGRQQPQLVRGPQAQDVRGGLNLRVPKLRSGSFFPEGVIERYQRAGRALVAAVTEICLTEKDEKGLSLFIFFV